MDWSLYKEAFGLFLDRIFPIVVFVALICVFGLLPLALVVWLGLVWGLITIILTALLLVFLHALGEVYYERKNKIESQ